MKCLAIKLLWIRESHRGGEVQKCVFLLPGFTCRIADVYKH